MTGFQRVGEKELAAAWGTSDPLAEMTRSSLLASRRSRDAVNSKVTRIRVTHEHLLRAFATFVLLLLVGPIFYALGYRNAGAQSSSPFSVVVVQRMPSNPPASSGCDAGSIAPSTKEKGTPQPGRRIPASRHNVAKPLVGAAEGNRRDEICLPVAASPAESNTSSPPQPLPTNEGLR